MKYEIGSERKEYNDMKFDTASHYRRTEGFYNDPWEEGYRTEINSRTAAYRQTVTGFKKWLKDNNYEGAFFEEVRGNLLTGPVEENSLFSVSHDYSIPLIMVKWFIKNEMETWFNENGIKLPDYYLTGRTA